MKLKEIYVKNFFSIQEIKLDFSDYGNIIVIEGKNKDTFGSNGSGKSSIYEAIVWGIFGRTIRRTTQDSLINNKAKRECEVIVKIEPNIEIRRVVKPPYLHLKIGDKIHIKESYQETQKFIEDYFKINYKAFLVSYVFGQQNEIDFLSASVEDKRTILKTFLSLDEFFVLRDAFKEKKNEVTKNLATLTASCELCSKQIEKHKRNIVDNEKKVKDLKEKYRLTDGYKLEDILIKEREKKELQEKRYKLTSKRLTIEAKIDAPNSCPTCGTALEGFEEKNILELEEHRDLILSQVQEILKLEEAIHIPISSSEYHKIKDIATYEQEILTSTKIVEDTEASFSETKTKKEKYSKYHDILKFWEIAFSEQGIIKYVINNILDYFNDRCLYYLSILTNGKYVIKFDSSLQETILINGVPTYYASLSGGERKKINFAVLLALQSLLDLTSKNKFNFLLLDEVVESIDDESINNFYSLLTELSAKKTVFIISHNNTLKELLVEKSRIKLIKSKGATKLAG